MTKRLTAAWQVVALVVLAACGATSDTAVRDESIRRPNILLIVADDMGFSDAGAFGGEMATPNIDGLAAEGVMFTEFHVAPNCGPTRGSLLTGVDYHRAGMGGNPEVAADNQKGVPAYQGFLRDDVVTLAELLHDAGYHTSMAGKWHLGHDARNLPGGRGFERSFALLNGAASHWADQAALIPGSRTHYTEDDQPVDELPADFYSTTNHTNRVIDYISESAADGRPFFSYLSRRPTTHCTPRTKRLRNIVGFTTADGMPWLPIERRACVNSVCWVNLRYRILAPSGCWHGTS